MAELSALPSGVRLRLFRHYVIDIETVDTKPTAAVLSIALVKLCGYRGVKVKSWVVSPRGQGARTIDLETVLWWLKQPKEAQEALMGEATDLYKLLHELFELVTAEGPDFFLWAKPQHFDISILESLFREFVPTAGPVLLHRRKVHNARTLYEAAGLLIGGEIDEEKPTTVGQEHNATADALRTADTIGKCLELLEAASVDEELEPALWRVDSLLNGREPATVYLAAASMQHAALLHRCLYNRSRRMINIRRLFGLFGLGAQRQWSADCSRQPEEQAALLRYFDGDYWRQRRFGPV